MAKKTKKAKASKGITASITPTVDWRAYMAKMREERKKEIRKLLNDLKIISAELYAKGITNFIGEYSGEGDSGDLNYTFYEKNSAFGDKKPGDIDDSTAEKLRDLIWKFVPEGFENNDGGFGTVTIDFEKAQIRASHSDRIVDVETTEKSFDFDGEEI